MDIITQLELLPTTSKQIVYGPFVSRKQAQEQGLKHYFTGKPCKHGHIAPRFTNHRRCLECNKAISFAIYHATKDAQKIYRAAYYKKNRQRLIDQTCQYEKNKLKKDAGYRLIANLRRRMQLAVQRCNTQKTDTTMKLLGCTLKELRSHLEAKFAEGMGWHNRDLWHVDHIRPCASFDLTDPEQQRQCFHYTNLQPLWAVDNIRKGAKWQDPS